MPERTPVNWFFYMVLHIHICRILLNRFAPVNVLLDYFSFKLCFENQLKRVLSDGTVSQVFTPSNKSNTLVYFLWKEIFAQIFFGDSLLNILWRIFLQIHWKENLRKKCDEKSAKNTAFHFKLNKCQKNPRQLIF